MLRIKFKDENNNKHDVVITSSFKQITDVMNTGCNINVFKNYIIVLLFIGFH